MQPLQEATVVVGTKQVLRGLEQNEFSCVYIAQDADDALKRRIRAACEAASVSVSDAESMKQLGEWCRIDVGAACVGVKKSG